MAASGIRCADTVLGTTLASVMTALQPSLASFWPTGEDLAATVRLAAPVVVVQVGLMAMGVVDTIVVGHLSGPALASVALGNLYLFATSAFAMGTLLALDPLISQAVGAQEPISAQRAVHQGLVLAVLLSVPTVLVQVPGEWLLTLAGQPVEIVPLAAAFTRASSPGVLAILLFIVARQAFQAHGKLGSVVVTIVAANVLNALLDWLWVFGKLGFPAAGAIGSAWASTVCRWAMAVALLAMARRELRHAIGWPTRATVDWPALGRLLAIGAPIGGQFLLEFAAFAVIALLMGSLGTVAIAAHQVTINLASLTYMVPLGVSAAAAVRVGHAIGRGSDDAARREAGAAALCGVGFMTVSAVMLLTGSDHLARLYTNATEVAALAARLIPIAGFFQVFDGLQVVAAGILRGAGDTRGPLAINLLGFWLIGLPISLVLAFPLGLGPEGLWWGLVAGLAAVATLLAERAIRRLRSPLTRLTPG